jgi:hypothetical protein
VVRQSDQAQPTGPRIDGPINGITPATKSIQAFALAIAQMSQEAASARTARHIEELRKARSMEEVASIELDFVKQSLEHAAEHTRKVCEMVTTLPLEMAKTYQTDWLQLINAAVQTTEAAAHAAAQREAAEGIFSFNG